MTSTAEAQQLLRQGRLVEAERAFRKILDDDPNDTKALNVVALVALRSGDLPQARRLLEHATAISANDPVSHHHLGLVFDRSADFAAAVKSQRTAIALSPDFHVARLHLGRALERSGLTDESIVHYVRALQDAQQQGCWLNSATTPEPIQPLVEHAVLAVRHGRRAAFGRLFQPIVEKYGRDSLTRVESCLSIYLNEDAPAYVDPRQQPTFLYIPGLPPAPYLDRKLFDWIAAFEHETPAIREELRALLPSADGRERVFASEALEQVNLRGLDGEPSWNGYYFYRHGERREANCARCPVTARTLDSAPLSRVREHGPEALYSVFTPGTHLLPHRGVTNSRLVAHLPLLVPERCALKVGGELHEWQEGKIVVFDDTYEHEAWNRSKHIRVVLIFDIWNPYLTEPERLAIGDLIGAIGDFRHAVEVG